MTAEEKALKKKTNRESLSRFCRALKEQKRFLLTCHVTPEGDAIGSMLAMDSLLRRLGKKTQILCEDPFPKRLSILSDKRWKRVADLKNRTPKFDALVITDCPTLERIGKVKDFIRPDTVIFNIDHHISNDLYGRHNYVRPEAAATAEVVTDLFNFMKMPLTRDEARDLYVGLTTDTGSFKYSNTTAHSHVVAAELIQTGIDIERINDELYSTYSLNKISLYSRLLARVKTAAGGAIAWVALHRDDLRHTGASYEDTEGFIDFLRYIREVKIAFFISELAGGTVRVSFRAKEHYDVNRIASHFEGGGHVKASGCKMHATVEEAEAGILERVRRELKLQRPAGREKKL